MAILSGVYKIVNMMNGNEYVGSSQNINKRWAAHKRLLKNNSHHSRHLQNAWNFYGSENFSCFVLLECAEDVLIENEQTFIDKLSPVYNVSTIAGRTAGIIRSDEYRSKQSASQRGKALSAETKKRISDGMKGKKNSLGVKREQSENTRNKIKMSLTGHSVSEETREKISRKNKGYKHTQEARDKIRASLMGNKRRLKPTGGISGN